ncbi:alpha/beta hydrolase [Lactobacillus hominis]|uniref:Alpha/beta superfamily hydrolase n=1 Tax=Lactobacillus hominis DSM 23910 = CRBIP 24.179 TaxID=1423758 RepID=I7IW51_9LACO|nr:alpha/beta fold hydrolase [Lactobacillus hominis]KRM85202.1 alpha beta superfamily hydrolase [Lactobacillus hominis DSM 23910 = CRBIP 24.179]MCT3348353.1 alpha/beta fold hydrolase [Lactobacillus hominis]CCI82563.1 Alpha/beta superfamily hydrolase [Lactobacillus hominis DSM 23910 = CRBIP 24.179]
MAKIEVQRDGLTLVGERLEPFGEKYDMAILFHGFKANKNEPLIEEIANKLFENNIASVRFDFDGCGESDGEFKNMTVPSEIADGQAILDYVRTDPHVNKIYLVGHSQGGVVASMLAGLYPNLVDKVVLLAPAATLKSDALKGTLQGVSYAPHHIPDQIRLGKFTVGGFYLRTAQVLPIYEVSAQFTKPVCVIAGSNDQVVNPDASRKYHEVYENSELHIIDGGDHRFSNDARKPAIDFTVNFLKPEQF